MSRFYNDYTAIANIYTLINIIIRSMENSGWTILYYTISQQQNNLPGIYIFFGVSNMLIICWNYWTLAMKDWSGHI